MDKISNLEKDYAAIKTSMKEMVNLNNLSSPESREEHDLMQTRQEETEKRLKEKEDQLRRMQELKDNIDRMRIKERKVINKMLINISRNYTNLNKDFDSKDCNENKRKQLF